MQTATRPSPEETFWSSVHPIAPADIAFMAGLRPMVEPNKGRLQGIAARAPFDAIMGHVAAPEAVTYRADSVGSVSSNNAQPRVGSTYRARASDAK